MRYFDRHGAANLQVCAAKYDYRWPAENDRLYPVVIQMFAGIDALAAMFGKTNPDS